MQVQLRRWAIALFALSMNLANQSKHTDLTAPLILTVGESHQLTIASDSRISVSRKGVIDVHLVGLNQVKVTGLKPGFIVITIHGDEDEKVLGKIFVEVTRKNEVVEHQRFLLPQHICRNLPARFCNDKEGSINGSFDDYKQFYKAKMYCEDQSECTFLGTLSKKGRDELEALILSQVKSIHELQIQEKGYIIGSIHCFYDADKETKTTQELFQHVLADIVPKSYLKTICKRHLDDELYTLFAKVILIEKKAAQELGLQSYLNGHPASALNVFNPQFETHLNAFLKDNKAQVIGEPVIWLHQSHEARVQSGGEMLAGIEKKVKDKKLEVSRWKEYGLDLKAKIFPITSAKILVHFSFVLRSPSPNQSSSTVHLNLNRIESDVQLNLDQASIVGGVEFQTSGQGEETVPFLSAIPIVGPLFKLRLSEESNTQLYLYFLLKKSREVLK